jgi:hypothetical protein
MFPETTVQPGNDVTPGVQVVNPCAKFPFTIRLVAAYAGVLAPAIERLPNKMVDTNAFCMLNIVFP